ncbi:hypothetical protein GF312_22150 [Candidatus Poribacteria bacterium]|nr:hypothetical protein [Candidatus Poribacteria bacterium]
MLSHFSKIAVICLAVMFIAGIAQAVVLDFEDEDMTDWEVIDEAPENLGDQGPSIWEIRDSQLGLDGKVLFQGSNIWGSAPDTCLLGTFLIYRGEQFTNFQMDVDVAAADNDGMGLVWAYADTDEHYRAIMINDVWPAGSVDGYDGPFMKIAKRISNEEPWYELLEVVKDDYIPYSEGERLHWTLIVEDGNFTFTREDGLSISAQDNSYSGGFVGIQLYAQQAEFDNITIEPLTTSPVQPDSKLTTTWGAIK